MSAESPTRSGLGYAGKDALRSTGPRTRVAESLPASRRLRDSFYRARPNEIGNSRDLEAPRSLPPWSKRLRKQVFRQFLIFHPLRTKITVLTSRGLAVLVERDAPSSTPSAPVRLTRQEAEAPDPLMLAPNHAVLRNSVSTFLLPQIGPILKTQISKAQHCRALRR